MANRLECRKISQRYGLALWNAICRKTAVESSSLLSLCCQTALYLTGRTLKLAHFEPKFWSRRQDSNPRPAVYKTAALPLSYSGLSRRLYSIHNKKESASALSFQSNLNRYYFFVTRFFRFFASRGSPVVTSNVNL